MCLLQFAPQLINHLAAEFPKQVLLNVRQWFKGAAWWLNPYSTETLQTLFFWAYFSELFLKDVQNRCMFWTLLRLKQLEEERQECVCVLSCLLKDTCWVAWLISSSFSRLSGLCGADYQEELIPVALLISLIRAPGRWLEGSCMSRGRSGTVICTGTAVVIYTTVKWWKRGVLNYGLRIGLTDVSLWGVFGVQDDFWAISGEPWGTSILDFVSHIQKSRMKEVMFWLVSTGKSINCQNDKRLWYEGFE